MATKAKSKSVPQFYRGAESCELRPDWADEDRELVSLLEACHAADPDDLTPQLALADWLGERGDGREKWVRAGCRLWEKSRVLTGVDGWDYEAAKATLAPVCVTAAGWRLSCLWGCLVAWHCPAGAGEIVMGRTWADERVRVVNRCVWWWAMGFLQSQADAAWSQAYAAWSQAYAARSQADAAGSQADAAWRQADAAGRQADAAGSQADAAWSQAHAAWSQAAVWRFARAAWGLCVAELPSLESIECP